MKNQTLIKSLSTIALGILSFGTFAQNNVGIGTTVPDNSAVLDLTASNKGLLVPRMDSASRILIAAPSNGLLVYDTDYSCFYYYRVTQWISLCNAGANGATGATGVNGTIGVDGVTGANGLDGATGPTGANGVDGVTGANGVDGVTGATGATGAGVGIPGGTGPTGANGTNGIDGVTGATGATGAGVGIPGATGPTGANGVDGVTGATGATGAGVGIPGATGPTGATGTNGTTGTAGTNGTNGATGATGVAGTNGATGSTGATGPTWTLSSATYNTDGTITVNGTAGSGGPVSTTGGAWLTVGNAATTASTSGIGTVVNNNFIGTTDAKDHVFATNSFERMRILTNVDGNTIRIGIGTAFTTNLNTGSTPSMLHLHDGGTTVNDFAQLNLSASSTASGNRMGTLNFGATQSATADKRSASIESFLTAASAVNVTGDLRFFTNNAAGNIEKMRIPANGNVLVNATTSIAGDVLTVFASNVAGATAAVGASAVNGYSATTGVGVYGENTGTGIGVFGNNNSTGVAVYGTNPSTGVSIYGDQIGAGIAGYFQNSSNNANADAIDAFTNASGVGNALYALNTNATGVAIICGGGAVTTSFFVAGSGLSSTGIRIGEYSSAFDSLTVGTGYFGTGSMYAGNYGRARSKAAASSNMYRFGNYGIIEDAGVGFARRSAGSIGVISNTIWGALGYITSANAYNGAYFTAAASNGAGRMMNPSLSNNAYTSSEQTGVGMAAIGGFMGGWMRGELYGAVVSGPRVAMYLQGATYTNNIIGSVITGTNGQKAAMFNSVSTTVDVTDRGFAQLANGTTHVNFDQKFANAVGSANDININITPYGNCTGVYVTNITTVGFDVVELNNGHSNVKISWTVAGKRTDASTVVVPTELLQSDFDTNIGDFMYNDSNTGGDATPMWWNGSSITFSPIQKTSINTEFGGSFRTNTINKKIVKKN